MKMLLICLLILVQGAGDWQKPLEELRRARTNRQKFNAIQALSASGADNVLVLRTLLAIELLAKAGKASRASLPDLRRLVERDPLHPVRQAARVAIDTIENDMP